ncbi:MAG: hypothetical protein ACYDH2_07110 [Anaerolineaceae bacterium]
MHFISRVVYHFFNIILRVILVVAGLAILVIGSNILMAKAADSANELIPTSTHVAYHIELPAFVPNWIREPVNTLQQKAELYLENLINLDNMSFLPTGTATPDVELPATTETPIVPTEAITTTDSPTGTEELPSATVTPEPAATVTAAP